MKEILKQGGKLYLRTIIINLMCFFIVISFSVLSTALFTENIGYTAYGIKTEEANEQDAEQTELYTYYFKDGDDLKKADYEKQGYTINTVSIRSDVTGTGKTVFLTISQIFSLLILIAFIYPNIWHDGTSDSNLVRFKHKEEDKLKGFKVGAVAVIPSYLFLIFISIAKAGVMSKFPVALYKFLNSSFYSFIEIIAGGATTVEALSVWRILLLFILPLLIPIIAGVAYLLGLNNYSIGEKLIYKKKQG